MNVLVATLFLAAALPGAATVSGQVTGPGGQPVVGARVFLEPGLGGALIETSSAADGTFDFDVVPAGLIGVFAIADGYAFGGLSHTLAIGEVASGLTLALRPEGAVAGKVTDLKGDTISGARVIRVLIMGASPVGIPLAKLTAFGFEEPVSDAEGRFTIPHMPEGTVVALKVGHPAYAQAGVQDVHVGAKDLRVQMSPGVLVQGTVLSRDGNAAVANAAIILRSASPPHDTAITKTDLSGQFSIKLDPGVYLYQAASVDLRSPGWEKLTVTGREPAQRVTLRVAGTARLTGDVRDAVTGEPVTGARLSLVAFGSPVAVVTTGDAGTYEFVGAEGENIVRVEAAPGYATPDRPYLTLQVTQGESKVLPTFWLVPLPGYRVQVLDENDAPVPKVLVRLIRPPQFGGYITNAQGWVSFQIAALPAGGKVVGVAEHPNYPSGALFSLDPANTEENENARIKLLTLATVSGMVVNGKAKPLEGAVVGALFQSDVDEEPLQLWRTLTDKDGRFSWNAVVPYVPMACLASTGPEAFGRSMPFNLEPSQHADIGRIVIEDAKKNPRDSKENSLLGEKLAWYEGKLLSGMLPENAGRDGKVAVILYTSLKEVPMFAQAITAVRSALAADDVLFALVADGPARVDDTSIPVLQGRAPGPATAYVLDRTGTVVLETWALPPLSAIAAARKGA